MTDPSEALDGEVRRLRISRQPFALVQKVITNSCRKDVCGCIER
jgi:hypothetical protein